MLLAALVAFAGTLIAFAGVTALLRGWFETRYTYLLVCAVTLLCLCAGLGAVTIGLALEFRPVLVRAYVVGAALLAMVWLALGIVEMVARSTPVKFLARLFVVSLSIVAGVILSMDPPRDTDAGTFPTAAEFYMQFPLTLLAVAHTSVVIIVSACFFAVAVRAWLGEAETGRLFLSCLLVLVAALLILIATRPELLALSPLVSVAAISGGTVLVWIAPIRVLRAEEEDHEEDQDEGFLPDIAEERPLGHTSHAGDTPRPPEPPGGGEPEPPEGTAQPQAPGEFTAQPQPATNLSDRTTTRLSGHAQMASGTSASLEDACGFIVIFTLREGAARPFDRLAEATAKTIREREPDTLIYACHAVADAPQQRIFYELYRDRAAMQEHERQPHVRRFIAEREQYVLATNVVRLKLNSSTGLPELATR